MIPPAVVAVIAIAGAVGAVGTAFAIEVSERAGAQLEIGDLLPAPPPRLPVPRFLYEKPEVLGQLGREG